MEMKKLYLFSYVPLGYGSPQFIYLLNNIAKLNKYDITVFETFRFWIPFVDVEMDSCIKRKLIGGFFSRFYCNSKRGMLFRLLNFLNIKVSTSLNIIRIIFNSYFNDITVIVTEPNFFYFFLSRRTKLIDYNLEIWEDETKVKAHNVLYRTKVDYAIFPQENRLKIAKKNYSSSTNFYLIENAGEVSKYPLDETKYENNKAIFSGKISLYNIDNLKMIIEYLSSNNIETLILGNIDINIAADFYEYIKIKKVSYLGFVENKELSQYMSKCSIGIITWDNSTLNTKYCAPNKLYEYMSNGLFILSIENVSMFNYISKYNCGLIIKDKDFRLDVDFIKKVGKNNYRLIAQGLTYDKLCQKFITECL
ncbi:hypothetical protein [Photobacterium damselae]|uniref:hypothetical protein n=1 Tax=Photobacterium damselae TaxID=38293 RepID=UPI0025439EC0